MNTSRASNANWFIALSVPADSWFSRVTEPPAAVRRFHPEDMHVTVAFLGPVGEQAAEAAFVVAPRWPTGPLDVTLGAVKTMGNPRRPNAFSAVLGDGADAVTRATMAVRDGMCARAGARIDTRPPLPHVTIARPARSANGPQLTAAIAWVRSLDLGNPHVRLARLVLYTHSLDRTQRLFREHAVHELDAGGTGGRR